MNKSTYIFILVFLASNCLDIKPFGDWLMLSKGVVGLLILFFWMVLGILLFPKRENWGQLVKKNIPVVLILLGVVLSMIPAYIVYGQPYGTSLIAYRIQFYWLVIPVFLYVHPSELSIVKALNIFGVLFILTALLRTFVCPSWFYASDSMLEYAERHDEDVICGSGFQLVLIPFYYYCNMARDKISLKTALTLLAFLIAFLIIQNRSTLFVAVVIAAYSFMSKGGFAKMVFLFIVVTFMLIGTQSIWLGLVEETTAQLTDSDYVRLRSIEYYLFEANKSWMTVLLGHGLLSAYTTSLMEDLREMGIYNSDVGFIGYWNQFGLIPIAVFILSILKALTSKFCSFQVKALGTHILICALTVSYFGTVTGILWFAFFYYLYIESGYKNQSISVLFNSNNKLGKYILLNLYITLLKRRNHLVDVK